MINKLQDLGIPKEILGIAKKLHEHKFAVYLVGGCLRDILLAQSGVDGIGYKPKDWDIATDAKPEEILKLFTDSVYENNFGTVGIKVETEDQSLKIVEVTTYRLDGQYTDNRHPDAVQFAGTIEEDLARRDFTVNSMAVSLIGDKRQATIGATGNTATSDKFIDPFGGQADLKNKIIRAVGKPEERFNEDALRLLRAVRFAAQLGFKIESVTREAIKKQAYLLGAISQERIRDEFSKLINSLGAADGIRELLELGLLKYIVPELIEGVGMEQNLHHIYSVFEHNVRALDYTVSKNYSFEVRLASFLHDVGKARTKMGVGKYATFYNHEVVGAKMTAKILERLKFSRDTIEYVTHLVRQHLFYYNVGEVSAAGVRRFLMRVGPENIDDLLKVREADRIGSGVPKAFPYKLRHLLFMIEKVKRDPISPKMLAVNGDSLIKDLKMTPSPRMGGILGALLEEVLDDPLKNTKEFLLARASELNKLTDKELFDLRKKSENRQEEFESGAEEAMKKKFAVK